MRRILLAAVAAALVLAAPAGAVTITEFDIEPGAPPEAHDPYRIHAFPDGNLYYSDQGTSTGIGRISPAGERLTPQLTSGTPIDFILRGRDTMFTAANGYLVYNAGSGDTFAIDNGLGPSVAVAVDATGLEIRDRVENGNVTRLCRSPASCTTLGGNGPVSELQLGADGRLWGVQPGSDRVLRVVPSTTTVDLFVPLPVGSTSEYLTAGPDGNIWVTAYTGNAVDRITPAGIRTRFPLPPGTGPQDIVTGPDGALWIAAHDASAIVRMTTAGTVTNVFPTPTPGAYPIGMTVGPDGAIWFTESLVDKIGRLVLDPAGGQGGGGGGGGATAVRDTRAPRVTGTPRFEPARVRTGRSTNLHLTLSEPARLKLTIARQTRGRRVDGRCVRPTTRNRRRSSCARHVTATTLNRNGIQGANTITVSARRLSPGSYRATIAATDPAGNAAPAVRVSFTVLARAR
jgi:streptogramin lyase